MFSGLRVFGTVQHYNHSLREQRLESRSLSRLPFSFPQRT